MQATTTALDLSPNLLKNGPMLNVSPSPTDGCFDVVPGQRWSQGFATYGGYVAASALKAARLAGHERPLLSAQVNYLAPSAVTGYQVKIEALRVGRGTSIVQAQVWSGQAKTPDAPPVLSAVILFTFGQPRESEVQISQNLDAEQLKDFECMIAKQPDLLVVKDVVPGFLSNFQVRPLLHGVPFSGKLVQDHVWAFRLEPSADDTVQEFLLLVSDINPPPIITLLDQPAPASTMTWMASFEHPLPDHLDDGWIYVVMHQDSAAGGYGSHSTMLFDAQGRHLTSNRQATAHFERNVGQRGMKSIARKLSFRATYSLYRMVMRISGLLKRGTK